MRQQEDKDQTKINALEAEAEKLQKVIKEADAEKLRQKKELDQVLLHVTHLKMGDTVC